RGHEVVQGMAEQEQLRAKFERAHAVATRVAHLSQRGEERAELRHALAEREQGRKIARREGAFIDPILKLARSEPHEREQILEALAPLQTIGAVKMLAQFAKRFPRERR